VAHGKKPHLGGWVVKVLHGVIKSHICFLVNKTELLIRNALIVNFS
jgi:hypothetical protein